MVTHQPRPEASKVSKTVRQVAAASAIGTTLEWYDFFIYSTAAALVFSSQFFPSFSGVAQTIAALSTVTIGYIARPLGSLVFGHFGDRLGRKQLLILSLLIMGVGTFFTGLLPNYEAIGVLAPILLITLRFLQGIALGGEWGGAVLMAVEHAPPAKRGFFGGLPQVGAPLGFILSTVVFLVPSVAMSQETFASWGWRIPFLLSLVLVFVGIYVRVRITESPEFKSATRERGVLRFPIVELIRTGWRPLVLGALIGSPLGVAFYIFSGYVIYYGATQLKLGRTDLLVAVLIGAAAMAIVIPFAASWSDRHGRRGPLVAGIILVGIWAFPSVWLIDTGNIVLVTIAVALGLAFIGVAYGPLATIYAELFDVRLRYSGAGLTYMLTGILGSGLAAILAPTFLAWSGHSWSIAVYMVGMAIIGLACVPFIAIQSRSDGSRRQPEFATEEGLR
jgi:MFS family permease